MSERTLCIIKPNAVKKGVAGRIISRFEDEGLHIVEMRSTELTLEQAKKFYAEHSEKKFYGSLINFMTSGSVVLLAIEGDNAVERVRKIMGATDPAKAEKNTIRQLFGDNIEANAVHGSDSAISAKREINFFFSDLDNYLSERKVA